MLSVAPYTAQDQATWDAFVNQAANATFMLQRGYMDYHAHRFQDASCMIWEGDTLRALLPAHRVDDNLYSHQGLTYGGLIVAPGTSATQWLALGEALLPYLHQQGIRQLYYRQLPALYTAEPQGAEDYALWRWGAQLHRRDLTLAVDLRQPLAFHAQRTRGLKKAQRAGLTVARVTELAPFHQDVLTPTLAQRHDAQPVHTADELQLLHDRFSDHIHQYVVRQGDTLLAGATLFYTPMAVHAQYIAATAEGRALGALDLLFTDRIQAAVGQHTWFNFGTVNEDQGRTLNPGLLAWKESFGAQPFAHHHWVLEPRPLRC